MPKPWPKTIRIERRVWFSFLCVIKKLFTIFDAMAARYAVSSPVKKTAATYRYLEARSKKLPNCVNQLRMLVKSPKGRIGLSS
jgi:hypothetical protein